MLYGRGGVATGRSVVNAEAVFLGRTWADCCLHPTRLTPAEDARADDHRGPPGPPLPLPQVVRCMRSVDHPGPHIGLVVSGCFGLPSLWLSWQGRDGVRDLFEQVDCDTDSPGDPVKAQPCQLPTGHAGCHTWEYQPDLPWPFQGE